MANPSPSNHPPSRPDGQAPHSTQGTPPSLSRSHLATEQRHPEAANLDQLSTPEALALFAQADADAAEAVRGAQPALAAAVELLSRQLARGGRLIYIGAGTSGRLGVLDASECPPTFQSQPEQVQAIIAGGPQALTQAIEGAEDSERDGSLAVEQLALGPDDVLLGISAGGTTPFVHAALTAAQKLGCATVFLTCVPAEQVPDPADVCIRLITGPELVAGSTRLKAGTATKMALNTLSTLTMVRLGKVYGNLMVDVDTSANAKLVERAERILMTLHGMTRTVAQTYLKAAGGQVKTAAVMHAWGLDRHAARQHLDAHGQHLRPALRFPPS